jgi:soluble lytic murein transglycosylase-like protein
MFQVAVAQRGLASPWDTFIYQAAGGDPTVVALTKAIIAHESEWNPNAVNPGDPSYGLMQVLFGPRGAYPSYTAQQLLDPVTNIELGVLYLRQQLARYSDLAAAISAYNAGHALVQGGGFVNQEYVDDVLDYFNWYRANDPLSADASSASSSSDSSSTSTAPSSAGGAPDLKGAAGVVLGILVFLIAGAAGER